MNERLRRLLTQSNVGSILTKEDLDPVIRDIVDWNNPLRQNLPRKKRSSTQVEINWRLFDDDVGDYYADTDTFTDETGQYLRIAFPFKTIGSQGSVTRRSRLSGMSYTDQLKEEIEGRSTEIKQKEDYTLIRGDINSSSNQFDGLDKLCATWGQTITMSAAAGGADLTLAKVEELLDKAIDSNMLIGSRRTIRELTALCQAFQRYMTEYREVKGGFKLKSYGGVPLYKSTNVVDVQVFDGTTISAYTGGETSTLYAVDTSEVWVAYLEDLTFEELARTSSQRISFDIWEYIVLIAANPLHMARLIGIDAA